MSWVMHVDGTPAAFAGVMRKFMRDQAPDVPLTEVRSMHESVMFSVWTHRLFGSLMAVFAVLALVIAAVGLYGVMAYSVAQRTQEIGIRMALGAQGRDVVNLVVGQALRLMLIGTGIGFAGAYGLTRVIASQLFGISAFDPPDVDRHGAHPDVVLGARGVGAGLPRHARGPDARAALRLGGCRWTRCFRTCGRHGVR